MGPGLGVNSLVAVVSRMAEGKNAGGQGPPQAFGQAGPAAPAEQTPEAADQDQQTPWDQYLEADPNQLDPTGQYELQQSQLASLSKQAGRSVGPFPGGGSVGGISTSTGLEMHGNRLRAEAENYERRKRDNAENWDRYLRTLQLEAEIQRLGLGPESESGTKAAIDADKKAREKQGITPSGYNPNTGQPPNQPQGQQNATPSGFGMARF